MLNARFICSLRRIQPARLFTSTGTPPPTQQSSAWRDRIQQWNSQLQLAESGDPAALTDTGWAYHKEFVPDQTSHVEGTTLPKSIEKAITMYKIAAEQSYSPASSLLADVYFYGEEDGIKNYDEAERWLNKVLEDTDKSEAGDAYVRSKCLQKLGVIAFRNGDEVEAKNRFSLALDLSRDHLKSNWAFILDHDPPGLWQKLEEESNILDDVPLLQKNFAGFASPNSFNLENPLNIVALRAFTLAMREMETRDVDFALRLQLETLQKFGADSAGGSWGCTYMSSFFRVVGNPYVQRALSRDNAGGKFVVLGSALGSAVVWPAAMFGFQAVGFDILDVCVDKCNQLIEGLKGEGGERVKNSVKVVQGDCLELARPEIEKNTDVVWSNCFSWDEEAQLAVENMAFESMNDGAVLILYREPKTMKTNKWSGGARVNGISTSWNPGLSFYVLQK